MLIGTLAGLAGVVLGLITLYLTIGFNEPPLPLVAFLGAAYAYAVLLAAEWMEGRWKSG